LFGSLSQAPIVVYNSEHSFLGLFIIYFVRENAHLLRTLEPMLGVVDERSEHHVTTRRMEQRVGVIAQRRFV
jgi:hypothetical protein